MDGQLSAPRGGEEGRSAYKRRAIIDAARTLFLRHGYAGASMDDIATLAKVSKPTVYKNFSDKSRLFTDLITGDIARYDRPVDALILAMPDSQDIERDLRLFARQQLATVMRPDLLRMRRVIIGEAERFPDLAQAWWDSGPELSYAMFARWFEAFGRRGLLRVDDPMLAAQHFNWLVLSIPLNKAMACQLDPPPFTPEELDHYADEGVRAFLAAYSTT